jgi:hypothetical protein
MTTGAIGAGCPECGESDGYLNAGKVHFGHCQTHRVYWLIGINLFSSWQGETEDQQRQAWEEAGIDGFTPVSALARMLSAHADELPAELRDDEPIPF